MLEHLAVRNLGILTEAEIDPSPNMTVITGETGTGKTLLLGGLRQLLSPGPGSNLVGPDSDQMSVDALFTAHDQEIGISRVVPKEGRSRTRVDGAIVSSDTAGEMLSPFVEIIGQHDQLSIKRSDQIRKAVDASLSDDGLEALDQYGRAWNAYQTLVKRQETLGGDPTELAREVDLARYQANEIEAAGLMPDLDAHLEKSASRLRNVEEIREQLTTALSHAETIMDSGGEVVAGLRKIAGHDEGLEELRQGAEHLAALAQEHASQTRTALEAQQSDPQALQELEHRLTALGDLKRKYGRTIEDVIAYGQKVQSRAEEMEKLLSESETIGERVRQAELEVRDAADSLTRQRTERAREIEATLGEHLGDLGMSGATVIVNVASSDLGAHGQDRLELLYASDLRLEPKPVGSVASGGELSRLVLAFRLAARPEAATTMVFDEVDAGLGGETARAMGKKLAKLAEKNQVLCVTHLPQVASQADKHYVVTRTEKGGAIIQLVEGSDRAEAVAKMMVGLESEAALTAAEELLALSAK